MCIEDKDTWVSKQVYLVIDHINTIWGLLKKEEQIDFLSQLNDDFDRFIKEKAMEMNLNG